MEIVGALAAAWNKPIIAPFSLGESLANRAIYPTLARVSLSRAEVGKAVAEFISELHWDRVALIYERLHIIDSTLLADGIREALQTKKIGCSVDMEIDPGNQRQRILALNTIRDKARSNLVRSDKSTD